MNMDDAETRFSPLDGRDEGGGFLRSGQLFGQYEVLRLLGRGGMGEVYAVRHRVFGTHHALKLINREISGRADARERFEKEAKVMNRLQHSGIVRVDEFGETDGLTWLRMELIEGGSLGEKLKAEKGKLKEGEAREILRQVLEGLAYAHKEGVVHRDLKPGNVLLEQGAGGRGQGPEVGGQRSEVSHQPSEISDRNSASFQPPAHGGLRPGGRSSAVEKSLPPIRAKIADFGLVKLAGEQWIHSQVQKSVARSMSMSDRETALPGVEGAGSGSGGTSTKALLGTYAYMSPEQKRGEEADASSDVYAVGLMA
ncbi:MAG: serine/threonine protein kinase, partial [Opitutales bacterium]|nr:serine/threonine protein kinase [Opitutales bacterium]